MSYPPGSCLKSEYFSHVLYKAGCYYRENGLVLAGLEVQLSDMYGFYCIRDVIPYRMNWGCNLLITYTGKLTRPCTERLKDPE